YDQSIRVRTDLFEIRAVVTDRKGNFVRDLQLEDFELLQEGMPQEISSLSIMQVPGIHARDTDVDTLPSDDAASSGRLRSQLREQPKRTAIFYVDTLNLAFENINWVKRNLHQFIDENLSPGDSVAISTSDGSLLGLAQQFTRDRQLLRFAIDMIGRGYIGPDSSGGATDALAPVEDSDGNAADFMNDQYKDAAWRRASTIRNLKDLVRQIADMPGQRMIVILSDGFTQIERKANPALKGGAGNTGIQLAVYDDTDEVINLANRHGVVIYSIDAKGLETGISAASNDSIGDYNSAEAYESRAEKMDGLLMLARDTGGELFRFTNNLSRAIGQAFDNNRYYYVLSYYPKLVSDADAFQKIDVRIRNHPEYRIRTARGFSPTDLFSDPEDDARVFVIDRQKRLVKQIQSAAVKSDIGVSAWFDFIRNDKDDRHASLTVYIGADSLTYRQPAWRSIFDIEIIYLIYDHRGTLVEGNSVGVQGTLSPQRLAQALENGFKFTRRLNLNPGLYQARVGVNEKATGLTGTTSTWIEIPDLKKGRLAMSSFALSDNNPAASDVEFDISSDDLKQVRILYGVPLFPREKPFDYSFHIYRNDSAFTNAELFMRTELFRGGRSVMELPWSELEFDRKESTRRKRVEIDENLDLSGFDPGIYDLRVSVRDRKLKRTVHRTTTLGLE
ncbi:MAG TPA: VWA domain-containing protein, partial [Acidobacteriota bacterium]|nr:VWA domain-containing protein [Acidobacteriota bacterium]